jgi:hypothetical protein
MHGVVGGPDELCDFEKIRDLPGAALEEGREGTGSGAAPQRGDPPGQNPKSSFGTSCTFAHSTLKS